MGKEWIALRGDDATQPCLKCGLATPVQAQRANETTWVGIYRCSADHEFWVRRTYDWLGSEFTEEVGDTKLLDTTI